MTTDPYPIASEGTRNRGLQVDCNTHRGVLVTSARATRATARARSTHDTTRHDAHMPQQVVVDGWHAPCAAQPQRRAANRASARSPPARRPGLRRPVADRPGMRTRARALLRGRGRVRYLLADLLVYLATQHRVRLLEERLRHLRQGRGKLGGQVVYPRLPIDGGHVRCHVLRNICNLVLLGKVVVRADRVYQPESQPRQIEGAVEGAEHLQLVALEHEICALRRIRCERFERDVAVSTHRRKVQEERKGRGPLFGAARGNQALFKCSSMSNVCALALVVTA
eukprot:6959750-Prymnesium_polylepis.1